MLRKVSQGVQAGSLVVLVLAILGLLNYLAQDFFFRVDLTEDKLYTISPASRKLMENLPDIVYIQGYFSRNLPPYLVGLERQVRDLLEEYRSYSKGKLRVQFQDPETDPKLEQRVQQLGIPKIRLNIIEKDKAQVRPAYLGLVVLYEDKKEVLPVVMNTDTLEYDITSAIKKLTAPETKTVAFLRGHEGHDIYDDYSRLRQELEKQYQVRQVDLGRGEPVPAEVDTLVVAGVEGLSARDQYELDQFLMRGGKLVLLLDRVKISRRNLRPRVVNTGLEKMLEHYGVRLKDNLVLDVVNATASFSAGFFRFALPYPYWVRVIKQGLAADHPALRKLETVVFPWTSSLELIKSRIKDLEVIRLASSSPHSWEVRARFANLNSQATFNPPKEGKARLLGVVLSGKFKSFFAGKEVPAPEEEEDKKEKKKAGLEPKTGENEKKTIAESPETQLLVVANSRLVEDGFFQSFPSNGVFLLNLIDWLNAGPELIQIRARQVMDRPLREISERQKSLLKFVNSFGVALLLVVFGLVRFYVRRGAQRRYEASFMVDR